MKRFSKFKKKPAYGQDDSEPKVTNQMSTFNAENDRLDPNAFTETNPHAGQTKTAKKKHRFTEGFRMFVPPQGTPAQDGYPAKSDLMRLYPGPNQPWNLSGSDKVASPQVAAPLSPPVPPKSNINTGLKSFASPKRVTPDLGPYGAPKGASGVTGVSNSHPFQKSMGRFGHKPRLGMKSITRLKRGM